VEKILIEKIKPSAVLKQGRKGRALPTVSNYSHLGFFKIQFSFIRGECEIDLNGEREKNDWKKFFD
jgi:hypothetical protein